MQWSRKGAHYLLQTRTAVLNNELQDKFVCWYPGFKVTGRDQRWQHSSRCPNIFMLSPVWGRLREGAESYAKALASDILR